MSTDPHIVLPLLLGLAVLSPLASFVAIFLFGPRLGKAGQGAGLLATGAIVGSLVLSLTALVVWLTTHFPPEVEHAHLVAHGDAHHAADAHGDAPAIHEPADRSEPVTAYQGNYYVLGQFGRLQLSLGYYIDALTVAMFCMVTLIASCIHFYSQGYMHEELEEVTDPEVSTDDGERLRRPGRYSRFFQFMSLFSFSMLGLVLAGNLVMTFAFWELVGICSYFLIGFYIERRSACVAANKAFIVNRVGDFGMIIGMMALWGALGTFHYGDFDADRDGQLDRGLFSQVRPELHDFALTVPAGMTAVADGQSTEDANHAGYWLLIVAGVGIFCGCVGKSAQFPLHVWLPDAMEGPTPVSALVHSATMVAAGVFLVARFYPVFAPEVLLVIAVVGLITLFMAATIAITATDIKRVLAYSTVSQLGYMMMALGLGGWLAGVLHLFTHAFFKSLLFLCSGSVIHAVHTNELPLMGGLRKKMPWTAYTMLVGCLAIAGAGIPFVIGLSGYYSKDAIVEQALSFAHTNPMWGPPFFYLSVGAAAITAFYMFRLWFLAFAGEPRDAHRYEHAHESPPVMYVPLVVLAVFAVSVAWRAFDLNLPRLLEQARPAGTLASAGGALINMTWPNERVAHLPLFAEPATWFAFFSAVGGVLVACVFYWWRLLDAGETQRFFQPVHRFLLNKWWWDELYDLLLVRPAMLLARFAAWIDRRLIDGLVDGLAWLMRLIASAWTHLADTLVIDAGVDGLAAGTYRLGRSLRRIQTGRLRQYVLWIALGTVGAFVVVSFFVRFLSTYAFAG